MSRSGQVLQRVDETGSYDNNYDYLFSRTQNVVVGGEISFPVPVLSDVPQGSVLGPLLFSIHVDDVTMCAKSECTRDTLYADDLMLYKPISCPQDFIELQNDIFLVEQWSDDNYLSLNPKKCKVMLISRKRSCSFESVSLLLNGSALEKVNSFKYLGVTISNNLTWSNHIDIVCSKARRTLGLIYRCFYANCNPDTLLKLYLSLVRPRLEYACPVWSPLNTAIKVLLRRPHRTGFLVQKRIEQLA